MSVAAGQTRLDQLRAAIRWTLRRGSPVVLLHGGPRGVLLRWDDVGRAVVYCDARGEEVVREAEDVLPDLAEPGGRWDAATFVVAESARLASHPALDDSELELLRQVRWREDLNDEDVTELRQLMDALLSGKLCKTRR